MRTNVLPRIAGYILVMLSAAGSVPGSGLDVRAAACMIAIFSPARVLEEDIICCNADGFD